MSEAPAASAALASAHQRGLAPANLKELAHRELRSSRTGEVFSLSAVLTERLGFTDLFVHHEIIPPGRRASGPHSHTESEELVVVLEGHARAHLGDQVTPLATGDFIGFAPGTDLPHFIQNVSDAETRILVIASRRAADQVV